jgi:ribonuclease HI
VFGTVLGHKSKEQDPFQKERTPARINRGTEPSGRQITISTDGSALNNGWENTTAGVGVWYADNSYCNIALKLKTQGTKTVSNLRAELGAILEALRQNEDNDLVIESDSLTSLRAICNLSNTHEDLNWSGIQNADLLKGILIRLRTRLAKTSFRWVKGHANNYGNSQADHLANPGRESEFSLRADEEDWLSSHPALQDGARPQTLEAKHIYNTLLKWHT